MNKEFISYSDRLAQQKLCPAQNTTGFLIRVFDKIMFRVYHHDKTFTDYEILHHDLEVTITDPDAVFNDLTQTLDYAH